MTWCDECGVNHEGGELTEAETDLYELLISLVVIDQIQPGHLALVRATLDGDDVALICITKDALAMSEDGALIEQVEIIPVAMLLTEGMEIKDRFTMDGQHLEHTEETKHD